MYINYTYYIYILYIYIQQIQLIFRLYLPKDFIGRNKDEISIKSIV